MSEITIIIPAYNESEGIRNTLDELIPFAKKNNWKIIVINDGSSDNSQQILKQVEYITVISHPYNKGYGAALKTGIINSDTEYIAMFDADGQHNPKDLEKLSKSIQNFDMVVGSRGKDSYQDIWRKPGKKVLSIVANFLAERKIPDINSGLRIVRRNVIIKLLHLFPNGFSFSTTSTIFFFK